ncbi:MAG: hypothetical protein COB10_01635 [Planctomycetota bacterium]|nr:MAG: hypothetical protein COB10_01635 [Planctomycetota bacterium]
MRKHGLVEDSTRTSRGIRPGGGQFVTDPGSIFILVRMRVAGSERSVEKASPHRSPHPLEGIGVPLRLFPVFQKFPFETPLK